MTKKVLNYGEDYDNHDCDENYKEAANNGEDDNDDEW